MGLDAVGLALPYLIPAIISAADTGYEGKQVRSSCGDRCQLFVVREVVVGTASMQEEDTVAFASIV